EYAGGYSDMVAQRGAGVSARQPEKAEPVAREKPVAPQPAQPRRKLSFKDKHALETLPGEMDALRAEIAAFQARLEDATLYARDPKTFEKTTAELAAAQEALTGMEDRWLELEMLREEIEG